MIVEISVYSERQVFNSARVLESFYKEDALWTTFEFDELPGVLFRFCQQRADNPSGYRREVVYVAKTNSLKTGRLKAFEIIEGETRIMARYPSRRLREKAAKVTSRERIPSIPVVVLENDVRDALDERQPQTASNAETQPVLRKHDHQFVD